MFTRLGVWRSEQLEEYHFQHMVGLDALVVYNTRKVQYPAKRFRLGCVKSRKYTNQYPLKDMRIITKYKYSLYRIL